MKRLRGGSGLGDALYVQSVARHLVERGESLEVCTNYPDVFKSLKVRCAEFTRRNIDVVAHYVLGKRKPDSTQWEDVCDSAKIPKTTEMRLDWRIKNHDLVERIKNQADGRPIIVVAQLRLPMGREDGFGLDLLPNPEAYRAILHPDWYTVQMGKGETLHPVDVCLDLTNKTTVTDLLDVASIASGFVGYPSLFIPLSESFHRPGLFVWARAGTYSHNWFIKTVTPKKLIHSPWKHRWVMDDWAGPILHKPVEEFRALLNS